MESAGSRGEGAFTKLAAKIKESASHLGNLAVTAGKVTIALGAGVLATLTGIGIRTAASLEQAQVGFNALLGGVEQGKAFFGQLIQLANVSAFEVGQLTGPAQTLLAVFKGNAPGATAALGTLVDAVALLGKNSPDALARVADGFGKAASQGRFSAEALNIIGEAIPGFAARQELAIAVSEKFGITMQDATERISKGTIDAALGSELLLDRLRKFPGIAGAALEQSKTLGGVLSTFSDTFKQALAFDLAGPMIGPIKEALIGITPEVGAALSGLGQRLAPVAAKILPQLTTGFAAALRVIPGVIGPIVSVVGNLVGVFVSKLPSALKATAPAFRLIAAPINATTAALKVAFPQAAGTSGFALRGFIAAATALSRVLTVVLPVAVRVVAKAIETIGPVVSALRSVIGPVFAGLTLLILGISAPVAIAVTAVLLIARAVTTLADKLRGNAPALAAFELAIGRIKGAFQGIGIAFGVAGAAIKAAFTNALPDTGPFAKEIGEHLPSVVDVLVAAINGIAVAAEFMSTAIVTATALAGPPLAAIAEAVGGFISDKGPEFAKVFQAIADATRSLNEHAGPALANMGPLLDKMANNQAVVIAVASGLTGIATGLIAMQAASGSIAVITGVSTALKALETILAGATIGVAGTIGLIVAAIAAVGIAAFLAYQHFKPFRDIVDTVGRFIRDHLVPIIVVLGVALATMSLPVTAIVAGVILAYTHFKVFRDVVAAVAGFFRDDVGPALVTVGGFLRDLGETLGGGLAVAFRFLTDEILPRVLAGFDALRGVLGPIAATLGGAFGTAIGAVGAALGKIVGFIEVLAEKAGPLFGKVRAAIGSFVDWFQANVSPTIGAGVDLMVAVFGRFQQAFVAVAEGLQQILGPPLRVVGTIIGIFASVLADVVRFLASTFLPILRVVAAVVKTELSLAFDALLVVLRVVGNVFVTVFNLAKDVVVFAFRIIKGTIESVLRIIRGIFEVFTGLITLKWAKVWQGLKDIVGGILHGLVTTVQAGFKLVVAVVGDVLSGLLKVAKNIVDGVVEFFVKLPGRLISLGGTLIKALGDIGEAGGRLFLRLLGDAFDGVVNLIKDLPGNMLDLGASILGAIGTAIAFVVSRLPGALESIGTALLKLPTLFIKAVLGLGELVWDGLKIEFAFIVGKVPEALGLIVDGVKALPGLLIGAVLGLGTLVWEGLKIEFNFIRDKVPPVIGEVVQFFKDLPGNVLSAVVGFGLAVWSGLQIEFETVKVLAGLAIDGIVTFFKALPGNILDAVTGLAAIISGPFETAFNAIADLWNNTVGKLSFTIPTWVPPPFGGKGFDVPDIPTFKAAAGGIAKATAGGRLGLFAEGGRDEAILPLLPGVLDGLRRLGTGLAPTLSAAPLIGGDFIVQGADRPQQTAIEVARELYAERYRRGG